MRILTRLLSWIRTYIPAFTVGVGCFALAVFLLGRVATAHVAVADWLNGTVCLAVRRALSFLTDLVPFSVAELLIYALPLLLIGFVLLAIRLYRDRRRGIRFLAGVSGVLLLFYPFYVLTLGIGYHTSPLADRLGLQTDSAITAEQLETTLLTVRDALNAEVAAVSYGADGASVYGGTMDQLSAEVLAAYETVAAIYTAIPTYPSRAKPVLYGEGMSYLRLLGIYTYFTGESNINTHYPDYTVPFTVAHEFAHQRGITPENEANFVSFLVCLHAEQPYLRYSGYLNMFEYLAQALARTDRDRLQAVYAGLDSRVLGDLRAYSAIYQRYADTAVGSASEKLNDTYLKWNGTAGVASYGLVVELAVAYYVGVE